MPSNTCYKNQAMLLRNIIWLEKPGFYCRLSKQINQLEEKCLGESNKPLIATLCKRKEKEVSEGSIIVMVTGNLTSAE